MYSEALAGKVVVVVFKRPREGRGQRSHVLPRKPRSLGAVATRSVETLRAVVARAGIHLQDGSERGGTWAAVARAGSIAG